MTAVKPKKKILFDPFCLDITNEFLQLGAQEIDLTPKTFAVLRYLAEHPGQLATKEELLGAIWPNLYVSDAALKAYIQRARKALGDNPKVPRFIETVHRRGYRFIGTVRSPGSKKVRSPASGRQEDRPTVEPSVSALQSAIHDPLRPDSSTDHALGMVGREAELTQLHHWLGKAASGERQIVFVIGEPGIGKTILVEALLERASRDPTIIVRGQCVAHYGAGEAYLPILEALKRLCREPEREHLVTLFRQLAPTWLLQMPSLIDPTSRKELQREILGTTRERMLRELTELVEALTADTPLVLVLEDLHWSDYSTLDFISHLAWRQEPARLLLLGTYRPVEVIASGHPLKTVKQELQTHGQCEELSLGFLSEAAVAEYLAARFAGGAHGRHWSQLKAPAGIPSPAVCLFSPSPACGRGLG